jgi:hypothetical protein
MAKGFKTGGRKLGQPNIITSELRELLGDILKKEIQEIPERLERLEDKERLLIIERLLGYVIPKVTSSPFNEDSEPVIVQIHGNI